LHYVNIALGIYFWRVFLYPEGAAQLLPVLFLPLKSIHTKTKAGMCCKCIRHKNHDKNKCRRDGERWQQQGYKLIFSIENPFT